MVWIAAAWLGIMLADRFSKREKAIDGLISFFRRCEIEISHYSLSFPSLIEKIASEESPRTLQFILLCNQKIKNGEDFPDAWKKSLEENPPIILPNEKERLSRFGTLLSSCDTQGVLSVLSFYEEFFKASLAEAKSAKKKYAKLCIAGGVFVGCVLFMTLI